MKKKHENLNTVLNKPKKSDEILREQIENGLREHKRPKRDLFLSAVSAGLEIGFSVLLMAALHSLFSEKTDASILHMLLALAYPLGFIFVVIGKSELFTEHTTLAVVPVLSNKVPLKSLLILWGLIYAGNLFGGYIFSVILTFLPVELNIINSSSYIQLAEKMIHHQWYVIVGSGVLAGWLMGLLSWLVTSSQDTLSRIIIIVFITSVIGITGLHHSIVGSIEVFTAMLSSSVISLKIYLLTQCWATLGNIIGGVVFVAFIKYSHINPGRI